MQCENANKTLQGIKTPRYDYEVIKHTDVKTLIKPCKGLKRLHAVKSLLRCNVKTLIKPCKGLKLINFVHDGILADTSENANKTLQGIKTKSNLWHHISKITWWKR